MNSFTEGPKSKSVSTALEATHAVDRACRLNNVIVYNSSGSTLYLCVCDRLSTDTGFTHTTLPPQALPANSTGYYDFAGLPMTRGVWAILSTASDGSITPAGDVGWFTIGYR